MEIDRPESASSTSQVESQAHVGSFPDIFSWADVARMPPRAGALHGSEESDVYFWTFYTTTQNHDWYHALLKLPNNHVISREFVFGTTITRDVNHEGQVVEICKRFIRIRDLLRKSPAKELIEIGLQFAKSTGRMYASSNDDRVMRACLNQIQHTLEFLIRMWTPEAARRRRKRHRSP
jgi:hypothetical protein